MEDIETPAFLPLSPEEQRYVFFSFGNGHLGRGRDFLLSLARRAVYERAVRPAFGGPEDLRSAFDGIAAAFPDPPRVRDAAIGAAAACVRLANQEDSA